MITFKVQVNTPETVKSGIDYVEYSSSSLKNIESAMEENTKFSANLHTFAPLPIWETSCRAYNTQLYIRFRRNVQGLVYWGIYKLYKVVYKRIPLDKYLKMYGVTVNND